MFETWDWYLDRFRDQDVRAVLKDRMISLPVTYKPFAENNLPPVEYPYYVEDIAKILKRSEQSISASLFRLEDKGKVERYQRGWRLKG